MGDGEVMLPGVDWGTLATSEADDAEVDRLHDYTGEGLLARDPAKYHAIVRGLFQEGVGVRAMARMLRVSPNTIHAIEQRELSLHPELIGTLGARAHQSLALAIKRGADAAAAAFLQDGLSPLEIAKALSSLASIARPADEKKPAGIETMVETDDYLAAVGADGLGGGECFAGCGEGGVAACDSVLESGGVAAGAGAARGVAAGVADTGAGGVVGAPVPPTRNKMHLGDGPGKEEA